MTYDMNQEQKTSLSMGVPQGSVMVPLQFISYVYNMTNVSDLYICSLFTDDRATMIID